MALTGLDQLLSSIQGTADLSRQVLSAIFGSGWDSAGTLMESTGTGAVSTLVYDLLYVLNCCGAVVIAWLFLLATFSATLGSAQEGRIGGRRFANAWIPLRYCFAMAAVTPCFKGMCAMQVLVLAALSTSISLADAMWSTGLTYISRTGAVAAVASPSLETSARGVVAGIIRHAALRRYLEEQGGCTFVQTPRDQLAGEADGEWRISFELPYPEQCTPIGSVTAFPSTKPGDTGHVTVASPSKEASEAIAATIQNSLYPAVYALITMDRLRQGGVSPTAVSAAEQLQVRSLAAGYAAAAAVPLSKAAVQDAAADKTAEAGGTEALSPRGKALADFEAYAGEGGWFLAGSYYWTLARLAADGVSMQRDMTQVSDPDLAVFRSWAGPEAEACLAEGEKLAAAALAATAEAPAVIHPGTGQTLSPGGGTPETERRSIFGLTGSFLSPVLTALDEFRTNPGGTTSSALLSQLGGHDMLFSVVRASRRVMNACEDAFAAYALIHGAAKTAEALAAWVPFAGSRIAKLGSAADDAVSFAATAALVIGAPVWAICWFFAYMVPAMPFIVWFTAVIGWIVLSLEAVIACPVWLVSHCLPEGEGFAGLSARAGYALIMSVLLRPPLLVLAFFLCMIIMSVSGSLTGTLLSPFFSASAGAFESGHTGFASGFGVTGAIAGVILTGTVVGIATWKLFTLVTVMPDRILRWAGQICHSLGDDNATTQVHTAVQSMTQAGAAVPGTTATAFGLTAAGSGMARDAAAHMKSAPDDAVHAQGSRPADTPHTPMTDPVAALRRLQTGVWDLGDRNRRDAGWQAAPHSHAAGGRGPAPRQS